MLFTFNIGFNGLIRSRPAWLVAASLASTDRKRGCLCGRKRVQKHALTALLTGSKKSLLTQWKVLPETVNVGWVLSPCHAVTPFRCPLAGSPPCVAGRTVAPQLQEPSG